MVQFLTILALYICLLVRVQQAACGISIDMYKSLFQENLLKTHGLHTKQHLTDALRQETSISSEDERPMVRIYCVDLALKLPEFFAESTIIFIDNNASILCFLKDGNLSDESSTCHGTVIPPALKISSTIVAYFADQSSSFTASYSSLPDGNNRLGAPDVVESLFVDLLPAEEIPGKASVVAKEILLLEPLLHRFYLSANYSDDKYDNSHEWHYLVLKALATVKSETNSSHPEKLKMPNQEAAIAKTEWTKTLQQAVFDLTSPLSLVTEVHTKSDTKIKVETWIRHAHDKCCPGLHEMLSSLLSAADILKQTTTSEPQLISLHGNSIQIRLSRLIASGRGRRSLLSIACLAHLIHAAAVHPSVVSVSIGSSYQFANYNAVAMSQSGTAYKRPFRAAGLSGQGQVCGVADTGLDDTSCFFRDTFPTETDLDKRSPFINNSDPYELGGASYRSPTTKRSYLVESKRRKVIQYVPYADSTDTQGGHGTHVCGTIVGQSLPPQASKKTAFRNGKSIDPIALFQAMDGVAPLAKIAFFDIAFGMGNAVFINMPRLQTNLFPTQYNAGARVSSNSWAGGAAVYGQLSYEVDAYLYSHPDFVVVLAAGNNGMMMMNNIGTPANSKNGICVGATQLRDWYSDTILSQHEHTASQFNSAGPTLDGRMKPDILATGYYLISAYASSVTDQLKAQHIQYGKTIGERVSRWNNVVINNQKCAVHEKSGSSMATPIVAGSALLVREYFMNPAFWLTYCRQQKSKIGMCKTDNVFEPTGYMTKALLIHSAQAVPLFGDPKIHNVMGGPMPATIKDSFTSFCNFKKSLPQPNQGYGEINLENVLPLPATVESNASASLKMNLIVFDKLELREFETVQIEIELAIDNNYFDECKNESYLKTTICWYDPPSGAGWASSLLIHDIDLLILGPYIKSKGKETKKHPDFNRYWGNGIEGGDHKNPNEQLHIHIPQSRLESQSVSDSDVLVYVAYLIAHAFPASRHSLNDDSTITTRVKGIQHVAVTMTSSTKLMASEFIPSSFHAFSSLSTDKVTENNNKKLTTDDAVGVCDNAHKVAAGKPTEQSQTTLTSINSGKTFLKRLFHVRHITFSDVKLGIHAEMIEGNPIFGSFENDFKTLDKFQLPTISSKSGRMHALAGVSICLDSPYVDVKDIPPSVMYSFPRRPGIDAYLLAITVTAPSGEAVQLGGYDWVQQEDNFFRHYWPFLWMSPNFAVDGEIDMNQAYCSKIKSGTSNGRNNVQSNQKFAAYRDVSLARLDEENNIDQSDWIVKAAYGISPYGDTPLVSYSGEIRLYFEEIDLNISLAPYDKSAHFPSSSSTHTFTSIIKKYLWFGFLITFALAIIAFALRVNKLFCERHTIGQSTEENCYVDPRTPLSGKLRRPEYTTTSSPRQKRGYKYEDAALKTSQHHYRYFTDEMRGLLSSESHNYSDFKGEYGSFTQPEKNSPYTTR